MMQGELVQALAAAGIGWNGGTPNGALLRATRAFMSGAERDTALIADVAASLVHQEPGAAAWMAVTCGSVVERGASAELSAPGVFNLLRSWLPKLPHANSEPTPEQAALLELFKFVCQSAVTHLSRLPAQREAMAQEAALLDRLDELSTWSHGAIWVREALLKSSGALVLLHPPSRAGLRLAYSNVSN